MSDSQKPAKVLFRVPNEDGSAEVETLWADDLGGDRYRLDNCPFYASGVSWNDVVYAPYDLDEEFPTFRSVLEKSGNRTIRVILDPPAEATTWWRSDAAASARPRATLPSPYPNRPISPRSSTS
ncbi:MAG TPA: DUF4265 domain-containing protein [Dongiaceae bacterium]|nr:DUF4265 domain-containing protein [Dongiaceae bacterium]